MISRSQLGSVVSTLALLLAAGAAQAAAPSAVDTGPAATAPIPKRPKICLVLSGGGARGAAHVGVLKVLEEYRIPIHCITGTSMGALVGGSYASGTTVPEMERITSEITTELLFKEKPPRAELSMPRKTEDYKPYFGPSLGLKHGEVELPKGVVTGVQLETVLRRLARIKGYRDFDKLPIPFRAVATDLVTGKAVVFEAGELANVMRASMSVPGAVAPAEFGGMILVDGMLTSNLPVQTARAMGADIVIAVNVGTPLLKREELTSLLGVTGQMLSILTEQNVQVSLASLRPDDILISPELGDYTTGDFDDLAKIVPLGETAARKVVERLAHLSLPEGEYAALRKRQLVAVAPDTQAVDEIRFENLARVNPVTAQAVMETKVGEPIDQSKLDADMRRLYGTGDFEHVNYRYVEESGQRVLVVEAVEKTWGPDYLRFGLSLSSDMSGDAFFNLLLSYRKTWVNSLGAEWRNDLQIGRTSSLATEFYQPINVNGSLFVAPYASLERRAIYLYQGDNRIAGYDTDSARAGLDVGAQFKQYGTIRLGVQAGTAESTLDVGPPELAPESDRLRLGAWRAKLLVDQIDSVTFPRSGYQLLAGVYKSSTGLGADVPYTKWDFEGNAALSFGNHSFAMGWKLGGHIGSDPLPRFDQFQWGGFLQMSGYRTGQLYGQDLRFGRLMYYHRVMKGTLFDGAYAGASLELGDVGKPLVPGSPTGTLRSGSLFVGADSLLGPVYLGYGRAEDGNSAIYFYLGKPY
jgi:NTE family protein